MIVAAAMVWFGIALFPLWPEGAGQQAASNSEPAERIVDRSAWLDIGDPDASWPGFTLMLADQRDPILIDGNANVVHSWPDVRVRGRARLLPSCELVTLSRKGGVHRYSWSGDLLWEVEKIPGRLPHHDLIVLSNGNVLTAWIQEENIEAGDELIEFGPDGKIVWRWDSTPFSKTVSAGKTLFLESPTHVNSIHEIVANRWHDAGDERFKPGNILVSARTLGTIFIVDKDSGEVVWDFAETLDGQHEALMIPVGHPHAGEILVFNNGLRESLEPDGARASQILRIHPIDEKIVWKYADRRFFSHHWGSQQPLPNGNLLVASSRGGRVFEIAPDGRIVWQIIPDWLPLRPKRYARDHCPELSRLEYAPPRSKQSAHPAGYVDRDLYAYLPSQWPTKFRNIGGKFVRLLKEPQICRRVFLPEEPATLEVSYGNRNPSRARRAPEQLHFRIELSDSWNSSPEVVFQDTIETEKSELRLARVELAGHELRDVSICLRATTPGGKPAERLGWWGKPALTTGTPDAPAAAGAEIDAEEAQADEEHLRALGYVE